MVIKRLSYLAYKGKVFNYKRGGDFYQRRNCGGFSLGSTPCTMFLNLYIFKRNKDRCIELNVLNVFISYYYWLLKYVKLAIIYVMGKSSCSPIYVIDIIKCIHFMR